MGEMTTRPISVEEFKSIIGLIANGFEYKEPIYEEVEKEIRGKVVVRRKLIGYKDRKSRPNQQVAFALMLEANIGLRISDIIRLKVKTFKGGKVQIVEKKTGELQHRDIHPKLYNSINEYAIERGLRSDDYLFNITTKAIHKILKRVTDHLDLINVSTHSFRKMYATRQYELNGRNPLIVRDLLNHSNLSTTEKYVKLNARQINKASSSYYLDLDTDDDDIV